MEYILLISFLLSFLVTFIVTPRWVKRAVDSGLTGKDMNKLKSPRIAEIGGICVVMGFLIGMLFYIALETFYFKSEYRTAQLMAVVATVLIVTIIGLVDDILGWKIGLRQWQKPLLVLFASLPIVVLNVGKSLMHIPFIGDVNFGMLYPFLLVPIAITGAANGFNLLGGFNGLEAGMGAIILFSLGFIAWLTESSWVSMIAIIMFFSLLAFYFYNKHPSKVFPGDTLTYSVGALIAAVAIAGNLERMALILFIPYFIELIIKAKNRFKTECFAVPQRDGSLKPPAKIGSLTHLIVKIINKINGKAYERDVVYSLFLFEIILVIIGFGLWLI
ncbi:MAG: glycosyltransferase 4 family protein [Nanoarchaeota archaeon]